VSGEKKVETAEKPKKARPPIKAKRNGEKKQGTETPAEVLELGESAQVLPPEGLESEEIRWEIADPSIATIGKDGEVVAVGSGQTSLKGDDASGAEVAEVPLTVQSPAQAPAVAQAPAPMPAPAPVRAPEPAPAPAVAPARPTCTLSWAPKDTRAGEEITFKVGASNSDETYIVFNGAYNPIANAAGGVKTLAPGSAGSFGVEVAMKDAAGNFVKGCGAQIDVLAAAQPAPQAAAPQPRKVQFTVTVTARHMSFTQWLGGHQANGGLPSVGLPQSPSGFRTWRLISAEGSMRYDFAGNRIPCGQSTHITFQQYANGPALGNASILESQSGEIPPGVVGGWVGFHDFPYYDNGSDPCTMVLEFSE